MCLHSALPELVNYVRLLVILEGFKLLFIDSSVLTNDFKHICLATLHAVTPLKERELKPTALPWLNMEVGFNEKLQKS